MSTEETNEIPEEVLRQQAQRRRFIALVVMIVAGLFCGVAIGAMVGVRLQSTQEPLIQDQLAAVQEVASREPGNQELIERVRQVDITLRNEFWSEHNIYIVGGLLLLVGAAALVGAVHVYTANDPEGVLPGDPVERNDPDMWRTRRSQGMIAVAVGMVVVFALGAILAVPGGADLPEKKEEAQTVANGDAGDTGDDGDGAEVVVRREFVLPREDFMAQWPCFRGPGGNGVVEPADYPTSWDAESGENIIWKTDVPMKGMSSPIIWGDRIFLTGATGIDEQAVFCFSRESGELLWNTPVEAERDWQADDVQTDQLTGYAAPTPVADGERVYTFFASADLVALDFEGNVVWSRNLGEPENMYGISQSPTFHHNALIVLFDQAETSESRLMFIDPLTGEDLKILPRDYMRNASWASPMLTDTDQGLRVLTACDPFVVAYDPDTREELWRAEAISGDVGPCPIYADGMVFTTNEYSQVAGIATGGEGNVTDSHVKWTALDGMSDASSPVSDGNQFIQIHSMAWMTCYDAKEGTLLWEHEFLDETVWSSLTLVGDTVYLPCNDGKMYMFKMGAEEYTEVSTAQVNEKMFATPAFMDGRIYLRGENSLFCIGQAAD